MYLGFVTHKCKNVKTTSTHSEVVPYGNGSDSFAPLPCAGPGGIDSVRIEAFPNLNRLLWVSEHSTALNNNSKSEYECLVSAHLWLTIHLK